MGRLKVIQIGGEHDHAVPVLDSMVSQKDLFEVAAYALPEDDATWQYNMYKDRFGDVPRLPLKEALELPGIQGAVIETSEKNLTKYARLAVDRGLAVHMDKPGGESPEEFAELMETVKKKGTVFTLGYMYRFNPAVERLMEMAKKGELGEIVSVEAQMNCIHRPEKRDWLKQYKGGMMFFLGCHLVDLIMQLQGDPMEIVPMNVCSGLDGAEGEDFGLAMLRYPHGWSIAKTTAVELGGFMRRQLVVCGTRATVEINPLEYYISTGSREHMCADMVVTTRELCDEKAWNARGKKEVFGPVNRYDRMMAHFARCAMEGKTDCTDWDYETRLHRAVMAASGAI